MSPRPATLVLLLLAACGADNASTAGPTANPTPSTPATAPSAESYGLHEWGLLTVSASGTQVTAGPMRQSDAMIVVEKPVIYLHTSSALDVAIAVHPGAGYNVAEHYPPLGNATAALRWSVATTGAACTARHRYPDTCGSAGAPCEVPELPNYETSDASCLRVGPHTLPLLFYRLDRDTPASLPVAIEQAGDSVRARRAPGHGRLGMGWRVTARGGEVRAIQVSVGEAAADIPEATQSVEVASMGLDAALQASGLSTEERNAFARAWSTDLFGEGITLRGGAVERTVEEVVVEEDMPDSVPTIADVLLYFLPAADVDSVARISATPAPTRTVRSFLVRQVL